MQRPQLTPAFGEGADLEFDHVRAHLELWRVDTLERIEALRAGRQAAETSERQLESPKAVYEFADFFIDLFGRVVADLERVLAELPRELRSSHADLLRQIASNAAVEQRKCLLFRDKWINRPLPFEQVRPLLTKMVSDVRDQLVDYRDLTVAAEQLLVVARTGAAREDKGIGRRELFSRLLGRDSDQV